MLQKILYFYNLSKFRSKFFYLDLKKLIKAPNKENDSRKHLRIIKSYRIKTLIKRKTKLNFAA